ncbi:hypothetical protein RRG08_030127 [Elysia crispata]|uniref:Uncharacterized protein n=1 Tax=Elysia crispata TaxID=231223 RepID=A0AAE1DLB9_9GAST|nr:hypothetical protein RRG08_030127 [Elysia crispata]
MSIPCGERLGVLALVLAALVIPSHQVTAPQPVPQPTTCSVGQYFDTVNNRCLNLPRTCPTGSVYDVTVGCRCAQGQSYNGLTAQCQNSIRPPTCPSGQFFDTINNNCLYDVTVGCRCAQGQSYNGLTGQCLYDVTVGCRCAQGQSYNGLTGQCQTSTSIRTCPSGQFFDTINNNCYNLPRTCPQGSVYDVTVGCRCAQGQSFNGLSGLCLPLPLSSQCPLNAPYDPILGCRCPNGQTYNGVTRRCGIVHQAQYSQSGALKTLFRVAIVANLPSGGSQTQYRPLRKYRSHGCSCMIHLGFPANICCNGQIIYY